MTRPVAPTLRILLATALALALLPASAPAVPAGSPDRASQPKGRLKAARHAKASIVEGTDLMVGLAPDADRDAVEAAVRAAGGTVVRRGVSGPLLVVKPTGRTTAAALAAALEAVPGVRHADSNDRVRASLIPDDPQYPAAGQWGLRMVGMPAAWDVSQGSGVKVAVIDSGAQLDHPDLAGQLDTANDWDYVNDDAIAEDDYSVSHGTHVSGIIAAVTDNGVGVASVSPQASILPLKCLDDVGYGLEADITEAIYYAVDQGARVINMSFGGDYDPLMDDALAYARFHDVAGVAATGNSNDPDIIDFPANMQGVTGVMATDQGDALTDFTNRGLWTDIGAPGLSIVSTIRGSSYGVLDGTSMSTPMVSAAIADVLAADPTLTAEEAAYRVKATAVDRGDPGYDLVYGHGRLDVARAVTSTALPPEDDAFEPDGTPGQATAAPVGHASSHTYGYLGEADWFAVPVEAGGHYAFTTSNLTGDTDTYLTLFDEQGYVIGWNDDVDTDNFDFSSNATLTATYTGTVYVESIDAWDVGSGSYDFSVAQLGDPFEPDDTPGQANPASWGATYQHSAEPTGDIDFHSVEMTAGRTYEVYTHDLSPGADTVLALYDADGSTELTGSDDVNGALDRSSRFVFTPTQTGSYYVANLDVWGGSGTYSITFADITPIPPDAYEPDDTPEQATPATWGATYDHNSIPVGDIDFHSVEMTAGRTYEVYTHDLSPGTDTVLSLLELDGSTELTFSDDVDGEADRSSRFVFSATQTGTFLVQNMDLWSAGGEYSITFADITPPPPVSEVGRLSGTDRYRTAIALSKSAFATGSATDIVLASGADYPDALSASGLAGAFGSPVLLTEPGDVPIAVMNELGRVSATPAETTVWVIGGTGAISTAAAGEISAAGYTVERLGGATRYETALLVADQVRLQSPDWDGTVFVATGSGFADALAASPLSYSQGIPVLLTTQSLLPGSVSAWLTLHGTDAFVLGGTGAVGTVAYGQTAAAVSGTTTRLAGANRFATATEVADHAVGAGWSDAGYVGLANGYGFADALAGGPAAGANGGVLLLTAPTALSAETDAWLVDNTFAGMQVDLFGGTGALAPAVETRVRQIVE